MNPLKHYILLSYKRTVLFLLAMSFNTLVTAQGFKVEREELNYEAKILEFQPGLFFLYSSMLIETADGRKIIGFKTYAAEQILARFKVGDEISIKTSARKIYKSKKIPDHWLEFVKREQLLTITKEGTSLDIGKMKRPTSGDNLPHPFKNTIFLDKKISGLYKVNGKTKGFYLEGGKLIYGQYTFNNSPSLSAYEVGDFISSAGYESVMMKGEVRPIENIPVYTIRHLTKTEGIIKSFLIKQNYAYVGLVLSTDQGDLRLSFASEKALELKKFADTKKEVTIYHQEVRSGLKNNPPPLFAAVLGNDTIRIERPFYGAPDGRHDTEPVVYNGEIKKLIKDTNNKLSVILTDDVLIEANVIINQLRHLIKKGTAIEVKGAQRIKRAGEVYDKEYKIIDPESIIINGKEYLLKQ